MKWVIGPQCSEAICPRISRKEIGGLVFVSGCDFGLVGGKKPVGFYLVRKRVSS